MTETLNPDVASMNPLAAGFVTLNSLAQSNWKNKSRASSMPSNDEVERCQRARRELPPEVLIYKFSRDRRSMLNNPKRKVHRPHYDRRPFPNFYMGA